MSLVETLSNGQNVFIYKKSSYDAKDSVTLAANFLQITEDNYDLETEENSGKKGNPTGLFVKTEPDNTNILNTINTKIFT